MVRQVESNTSNTETLKFLCSYGGKILPRSTDGKLRYVGGLTRVFSVERSVSYAELIVKLGEFCGYSVTLRCQLPNGDLETLVSVKSDEDLANLIEEYDRAGGSSKIRAILSPPASLKQISPPASVDFSATSQRFGIVHHHHRSCSPPSSPSSFGYPVPAATGHSFRPFHRNSGSPPSSPLFRYAVSGKACCHPHQVQGNPRSLYCGPLYHKNY